MLCKITSTLHQVCFFLKQKMGPTWSQLGSKLAQVGVMLTQIDSKLTKVGPCWLQDGFLWKTLLPGTCSPPSWPQVGSMLAPCCFHVGSMLAPCWLMVGPCWLMLDQVASKMAQNAIMLTQVGLKMANMASKSKCWSIFDPKLLILEHPGPSKYKENTGFKSPFAFCTFLFLLIVS